MANKALIRKLHFKDGLSIRRLAKDFGYARQTIRKALETSEIPTYTRKIPYVSPVLNPVIPIIKEWLQSDRNAPAKQRHTAAQIYRRLVNEYDFTGGESTVRRFVRQLRLEWQELTPPSSIPLEFELGEYAQFDWGEAFIDLNGKRTKVMLFCMRLLYSRKIFLKIFPHQRQEALFQGHADSFSYFGGVPKTIIYDNMKTAVKKVLEGTKREEQLSFVQFRTHYLFDAQFCAPAKGNEKGQVEKLVQTSRSQFLVPVPNVTSIQEVNTYLLEQCDRYENHSVPRSKETVGERFLEEQKELLPLPDRHTCGRKLEVTVNTLSLVTFETNMYSVPTRYSGRKDVLLYAYVDQIDILIGSQVIASHSRTYDRHQEVFELDHYLDELERKPRAIEHARPLKSTPLPAVYKAFHQETLKQYGHAKELIRVLKLHREFPAHLIEVAIQQSTDEHLFTCDAVKQFIYQVHHPAITKPHPLHYHGTAKVNVKPPSLDLYDQLLKKGSVLH